MLVSRFEVAIEEDTNYSCEVPQCGRTERIVNEPLDEALDGRYGYVFSLHRLAGTYRLVVVPCLVGISTAPGTE
jgi:hypothetical protein